LNLVQFSVGTPMFEIVNVSKLNWKFLSMKTKLQV
jgi:hypothetical protein